MVARRTAKWALAAALIAITASFAFVATALAGPSVSGADFHASGSALESGEVDVLTVAGETGDTVFVTVKQGDREIAKFIPYTLGEGVVKGSGDNWTGVVTLDISSFDLTALNGKYTIEAYATRAGGDPLYTGAIYGVYADLPDGSSKLVGTRTMGTTDSADRAFEANDTLYVDGRSYRLASEEGRVAEDSTLHFAYVEYDEATTVDGVVKYVDQAGNVIATDKIAGIPYGEKRTVSIPSAVTAGNGDVYRTVFFKDTVTAENPGATAFTVACVKMSDAEKAAANHYVATIQLIDDGGKVIATDSVNVTGLFRYTTPTTIYKTQVSDTPYGEPAVITYKLVDEPGNEPNIELSAADDKITTGSRIITRKYEALPPEPPEIDVTFNLIDGTKRIGEEGRVFATSVVNVNTESETAVPESSVDANGTTFKLVGAPEDYSYSLRSGKVPVVNVYYTPEGYVPPGPYDVTVNYVNFLTGEVVSHATYTSSPDSTSNIELETPESFTENGVEYVRLAGQEQAISHSYYSGIRSYTVYYRDVNDTLTSGTVINTIRVVYADGGETAGGTTTTGTTGTTVVDGGTTTTTTTTDAGGDVGAGAAAAAMQLNGARTYNVFDGEGNNSTLTNESGVDSNTERIEDEETPLASGLDQGTNGQGASALQVAPAWALPAGIAAVLVAVAIAAFIVLIVRRKRNAREEA